jgi:hypothetical protein
MRIKRQPTEVVENLPSLHEAQVQAPVLQKRKQINKSKYK